MEYTIRNITQITYLLLLERLSCCASVATILPGASFTQDLKYIFGDFRPTWLQGVIFAYNVSCFSDVKPVSKQLTVFLT